MNASTRRSMVRQKPVEAASGRTADDSFDETAMDVSQRGLLLDCNAGANLADKDVPPKGGLRAVRRRSRACLRGDRHPAGLSLAHQSQLLPGHGLDVFVGVD